MSMNPMRTLAMRRHSDALGSILLVLLALCGLQSVYRLTNFLSLAGAQPAYAHLWLARIWLWVAVSLVLAVLWVALFLMIVRHGRQGK
jgi:uncharacterized membrane protein YidH (DUF202 family)